MQPSRGLLGELIWEKLLLLQLSHRMLQLSHRVLQLLLNQLPVSQLLEQLLESRSTWVYVCARAAMLWPT
jgi:hypothetical protein